MKKIRTRFAPSPTGYIHIGNIRSAIYPFLIAKQAGGQFILRIEDTDQARFVEGATELILDTLRWLHLEWDEGPIKNGPFAPYIQSARKDIYLKWAKQLLADGRAYAESGKKDCLFVLKLSLKNIAGTTRLWAISILDQKSATTSF